ncbi:MAG: serine/threonine protein kinase [Bradymonadales bacterium]|nr:serine/threonine protein kinase [Bradymonadales bacterium]
MDFPKRYAQYSLLKRIAAGSHTDTFLARRFRDEGSGREFVIKRLLPELAHQKEKQEHFQNAAQQAASLQHPHIAAVFEYYQVASSSCHLCMEYVWGEDLWRIAERGNTAGRFLPLPLAVLIASDIAQALRYCHEHAEGPRQAPSLFGADLSPSNILVGFDGHPKILDFGVPLSTLKTWKGIRRGPLEGKLAYASPELLEGATVDARSDLFSLGILLWEFTTCKRLFKGVGAAQIEKLVMEAQVPPPAEIQPGYPPELERLVLKALARNPDQRFQTAAEMHQELNDLLVHKLDHPSHDQLAEYVQSILPDKMAEIATLLGNEYRGPDLEQVQALPWAPFKAHREERITPIETTKPARPEPRSPSQFPALAPLPSRTPVDGLPAVPPEAELSAPPPPPPPPIPQPLRTPAKSVLHTLRKDHPDEFEKTAQRSSQVAWVLGITIAGVAVAIFAYYLFFYHWPWEGLLGRPVEPPGPVEPLAPRQMPETIPVQVTTTPPGAAVTANGIIAPQRTPTSVPLVPQATNNVGLFLDGYRTLFYDLDLSTTHPEEGLTAELTPMPLLPPDPQRPPGAAEGTQPTVWPFARGRLNVTSRPSGATILRNGGVVCQQTPCEFDVPAGEEQHITAQLPDHLDTVAYVQAPPWEHHIDTKYLQLELTPVPQGSRLYTYLELTSAPRGARVYLNGERIGRTPLNIAKPIDSLLAVEMQADEYQPWKRIFYPSPGHIRLGPVLEPLPRPQAQLSLVVDAPDMPGTRIYLGPNEIGSDAVESVTVPAGTYALTLSYTPPPTEPTSERRRSRMDVELPAGTHISLHYRWSGTSFELVNRSESPAEFPRETP